MDIQNGYEKEKKKMKSIILINCYFGKLPEYFDLWLKSVKANPTVDFLIVTDDKRKFEYPKNVKVKYTTFEKLCSEIKSNFDFEICLNKPYKLCEYKPFYNLFFQEIVKKYDFWGYCDLDLIFGDIRKFVNEEVLNTYEKIYNRGHLTLFKNSLKINKVISCEKKFKNFYNYREAFSTNYVCHFDEGAGITKLFQKNNILSYDEPDYADINMKYNNFNLLFRKDISPNNPGIFLWKDGKLYFCFNEKKVEIIYAHFQKRRMLNNLSNINDESFLIIPNSFIDYYDDYNSDMCKYLKRSLIYTYYIKKRLKTIIDNLKNGAIYQKFYRLEKRLFLKN